MIKIMFLEYSYERYINVYALYTQDISRMKIFKFKLKYIYGRSYYARLDERLI